MGRWRQIDGMFVLAEGTGDELPTNLGLELNSCNVQESVPHKHRDLSLFLPQ